MPEASADGLAMAELRQRVSLQSTTLLADSSVDTENADFPGLGGFYPRKISSDFRTLLIPICDG